MISTSKCDTEAINGVPAVVLDGKPAPEETTSPWPTATSTRARRQSINLMKVPKWNKTTLTYRISIFPTKRNGNGLDQRTVTKEFQLAFGYWEKASNLHFQEVTDPETKASPLN